VLAEALRPIQRRGRFLEHRTAGQRSAAGARSDLDFALGAKATVNASGNTPENEGDGLWTK
jgi:hypothetical protein